MVFPVAMYESRIIKKAEHQRTDAFELWSWSSLLRVSWTARQSNQSTLEEISSEYSLEGLIWSWNSITLATWCKELTHLKRLWLWERLKVGVKGDDRGWNSWMVSLTQWTWVWTSSGRWWCHPTISCSVVPFSSYFQSFLASGSFLMSQLFTSGGQSIGPSALALASVLPLSIQDWFSLRIDWLDFLAFQRTLKSLL